MNYGRQQVLLLTLALKLLFCYKSWYQIFNETLIETYMTPNASKKNSGKL